MYTRKRYVWEELLMKQGLLILFLMIAGLAGCDDSGGKTSRVIDDGLTDEQFRVNFADHAVSLWLGTDYTFGGDGSAGIDGAGTVVMTLRDLGYDISLTIADGLYTNVVSGTTHFGYTIPSNAADADFDTPDYSNMEKGDLIFLDYDFDDIYDHVAIYLGAYSTYTHAAFTASDYYDECVIEDLDDSATGPLALDIGWSNTSSRRLDHGTVETRYSAP
jgi:hypothetical protein